MVQGCRPGHSARAGHGGGSKYDRCCSDANHDVLQSPGLPGLTAGTIPGLQDKCRALTLAPNRGNLGVGWRVCKDLGLARPIAGATQPARA